MTNNLKNFVDPFPTSTQIKIAMLAKNKTQSELLNDINLILKKPINSIPQLSQIIKNGVGRGTRNDEVIEAIKKTLDI